MRVINNLYGNNILSSNDSDVLKNFETENFETEKSRRILNLQNGDVFTINSTLIEYGYCNGDTKFHELKEELVFCNLMKCYMKKTLRTGKTFTKEEMQNLAKK